jgi:hypothetical protein
MSSKPKLLLSLLAKLFRFSSAGAPVRGGRRPDGCSSPTGESDGSGEGSGLSTVPLLYRARSELSARRRGGGSGAGVAQ